MPNEVLFENPILRVEKRVSEINGKTVTRSVIDMPPAVMVIAIDAQNRVHLLREYMAPTDDFELTFAKGRIDEGETAVAAAKRELNEELGLTGDLEHLMTVHNQPSHSTAVTHIYVAHNCVPVSNALAGDEEAGTLQHTTTTLENLLQNGPSRFKCVRCIAATQQLLIQSLTSK